MVGIVKEIDGQKKIVPLTTDAGTGAPVGTLIQQYKKVPLSGYLYCDGSTFDENAYPALYMYLGTNVLPDYRECVMVGAEQNTTDTITTHDVYGEGEFKDDQLQDHYHNLSRTDEGLSNLLFYQNNGEGEDWHGALTTTLTGKTATIITTSETHTGRGGDTTHGKQKAVYVYIKATSGLAENQQENVLNDVKEYITNAFKLSPIEEITITEANQIAQYDGILFIRELGNNSTTSEIYVNDEILVVGKVTGDDEDTIVLPICKGDTFRVNKASTLWKTYARWYKNR